MLEFIRSYTLGCSGADHSCQHDTQPFTPTYLPSYLRREYLTRGENENGTQKDPRSGIQPVTFML